MHKRLKLAPEIRLRKESFGGLVFDRRNGNILEVDKEAFVLLSKILHEGVLPETDNTPAGRKFVNRLLKLKILEECELLSLPGTIPCKSLADITNSYPWLSAPETVHWAATYKCKLNCPDCYASRLKFSGNELGTKDAMKLLEKIAAWNVFQLAIGGGEPLERNDISELVRHASSLGLIVHLTTGKQYIPSEIIDSFSGVLTSLQFGIHADYRDDEYWKAYLHDIAILVERMSDAGINVGANLCLSKSVMKDFSGLFSELTDIGLKRFTLLRYKPPASIPQWRKELPDAKQYSALKTELEQLSKSRPEIVFRIDCALSFLQNDLPEQIATQHGIIGCVAGNRIAAIAPDGSLYPCSQLVSPDFCAGNLCHDEPEKLWHESRILRKYRSFRKKKSFKTSHCGICNAQSSCGGCRVFSEDAIGGDPHCPFPSCRPLNSVGKNGRSINFKDYISCRKNISVGEYMERYGVGQNTAINEMRNAGMVPLQKGIRRKKKDVYRSTVETTDDIIQSVQDSIGYTSNGFPYATEEQVAEWIGLNDRDYPAWIIKQSDKQEKMEDEDYL